MYQSAKVKGVWDRGTGIEHVSTGLGQLFGPLQILFPPTDFQQCFQLRHSGLSDALLLAKTGKKAGVVGIETLKRQLTKSEPFFLL